MECVNDETFGPLGPLIEFQDEAEVIEAANRTEYGFGREGDWKACMISSKHKQPLAHNVMLARKTSVREVDEISLKYSRRAKPTTFLSAWCVGRNQ